MSFFGFKEKKEIERLKQQMSPEQITLADVQGQIDESTAQLEKVRKELAAEKAKLDTVRKDIIETREAVLLQSFGYFTPHYLYAVSDDYKVALSDIRAKQKKLIKDGDAITGNVDWAVNGSKQQGKKMVSDTQKLLLRAFNAECDDAIEHVRFSNYDSCLKKIETSYSAISKLGTIMDIRITSKYFETKKKELRLMYEYQLRKQEEKDAAKAAREQLREEAKLAKEIEEARKKLQKEQAHYSNALAKVLQQMSKASPVEIEALEAKKAELEQQISEIDHGLREVDYREANQKAGYVYIISNIGAFGENVYKIGMTRRLDPIDRIDELGDASVPFDFDVHALIFSENAPALEAALHKAFESKKLNMINTRREFFRVSLDEIKEVVQKNFDKSVEFVDIPPAEQYRKSVLLRS